MIKLDYAVSNFELTDEQKELIKEKLEGSFSKYGEYLEVIEKLNFEHNEYIIHAHSYFLKKELLVTSHSYDIYLAVRERVQVYLKHKRELFSMEEIFKIKELDKFSDAKTKAMIKNY